MKVRVMWITVILTILAIVFGYFCFVLPEAAAPFLAVFLIYFIWKMHDFSEENKKLQENLEEIKQLLQTQINASMPQTTGMDTDCDTLPESE